MKRSYKILIWILSVIISLFLVLAWYQYEYSMDQVYAYSIHSPNLDTKLLIATQGSAFKDAVTSGIINHYKQDSVYIEVIDVSDLYKINPENYNALVIIHTWENWKPPKEVEKFIGRVGLKQANIIVLTTSGAGDSKMEGIDALTGESRLDRAASYSSLINKRLELFLKTGAE